MKRNVSLADIGKVLTTLLMGIVPLAFLMIIGCAEEMDMMDPVISDPAVEPTTTVGDEKQDPEPAESEPAEPETPVEDPVAVLDETTEAPVEEPTTELDEPVSTVTLPPGYELPPELIPDTLPTLSENEAALAKSEQQVKKVYPDIEPDAVPNLYTQAGYTADLISTLPHKEREEVYDLFIASIDLPFFEKAAKKMKEVNIRLITLNGEAYESGDWGPYDTYRWKAEIGRGLGHISSRELEDIYFEENPQDMQYEDGNSRYWMILEWYRLQLVHPAIDIATTTALLKLEDLLEMKMLYRKSCANGIVFGLDNPWH